MRVRSKAPFRVAIVLDPDEMLETKRWSCVLTDEDEKPIVTFKKYSKAEMVYLARMFNTMKAAAHGIGIEFTLFFDKNKPPEPIEDDSTEEYEIEFS